ncbi:MAG: ATP-binding cassette domain-containing protein [Candidatus Enteromonas sp.]|nr:ATP-binding cassette domain-containing protein [Candidatus Enteromonas sp.]
MIEVKHVKKYFSRPFREPGLIGAVKSLFTRKKIITKAVDDVSFAITDGEIVGYIGSNGAGKSTTIKMMTGILTPSEGEILYDGKRPYDHHDRRSLLKDIGVVFGQRTQLWWDLPLRDSFDLYRDIYEIPKDEYEARVQYLSELLGLEPLWMSQVRTMSLGQRMRADLAASLIHRPKVLFLDEPTIGLDVLVKDKIVEAIHSINRDFGTTVILTTHDMKDIQNLCERIIILDEGKILYDGPLSTIKERFGDIRKLRLLTEDEIDLSALQGAFPGVQEIKKSEDGYSEIAYNASKVSPEDLLQYLIGKIHFTDIKMEETSLADIVKRIYATKEIG